MPLNILVCVLIETMASSLKRDKLFEAWCRLLSLDPTRGEPGRAATQKPAAGLTLEGWPATELTLEGWPAEGLTLEGWPAARLTLEG